MEIRHHSEKKHVQSVLEMKTKPDASQLFVTFHAGVLIN